MSEARKEELQGRAVHMSMREIAAIQLTAKIDMMALGMVLRAKSLENELFEMAAQKLGAESLKEIHGLGLKIGACAHQKAWEILRQEDEGEIPALDGQGLAALGKTVPMEMKLPMGQEMIESIIEMMVGQQEEIMRILDQAAKSLGFEDGFEMRRHGVRLSVAEGDEQCFTVERLKED